MNNEKELQLSMVNVLKDGFTPEKQDELKTSIRGLLRTYDVPITILTLNAMITGMKIYATSEEMGGQEAGAMIVASVMLLLDDLEQKAPKVDL